MNSLTVIFVLMVAAEHLYIMFLETFANHIAPYFQDAQHRRG